MAHRTTRRTLLTFALLPVALLSCCRPKPELRLVYRVAPTLADATERARVAPLVADGMRRRLDDMHIAGATAHSASDRIVVELPAVPPEMMTDLKAILGRQGKVGFQIVDDEHDWAGAPGVDPPRGVDRIQETAPIGPGKVASVHFLHTATGPGETMKQARARLEAVVLAAGPPADREVAYGRWGEEADGWRTYLLHRRVELGNESIRRAEPRKNQGGAQQWAVAVEFTDPGATVFELMTQVNVKRRFAIVFDGEVMSAPVIQSVIKDGHALISLGQASVETQETEASRIALVLSADALAAPVLLESEERIGK